MFCLQIGVCRNLSGMPPAAHSVRWDPLRQQWARVPYFLIRQEIGERIDPRRSPLGNPRRQGQTERNRALDCRFGVRTPRYQLALRRSRSLRRFVPTHGGADAGATAGTPCRSCPKRGGDQPIAAHEVKRRPQMICRAHDGALSLATRAGSQRAEPFGVSFVQPFLHEQKRAGRRRQKLPYFIPRFLPGSAADGSESRSVPLCRIRPDRSTRP